MNNITPYENVVDLRISNLEDGSKEMRQDIRDVKDLCIKMDKKLSTIPVNGFHCDIHGLKIDDLSKRVYTVENKTESITKKIVMWTSAVAVIIFIISNLAIPYMLANFKIFSVNNISNIPTLSDTNRVAVKSMK